MAKYFSQLGITVNLFIKSLLNKGMFWTSEIPKDKTIPVARKTVLTRPICLVRKFKSSLYFLKLTNNSILNLENLLYKLL